MGEKDLVLEFELLWRIVKKARIFILTFGLIFAVVSAFVVLSQPNEYTSVASVMPELESSSSSGLGRFAGLASLAGLDLSTMNSSDAIRPNLYPNVINNSSFFLFLMDQDIVTSNEGKKNFLEFYIGAYDLEIDTTESYNLKSINESLGLLTTKDVSLDSTSEIIYIQKYKGEIIEDLKRKITASMDKKTGIISVTVELPDALAAAHVAKISMDYLTSFVTNYRTEKARQDLYFLKTQLDAAKENFDIVQSKRANYSDQYQSSTMRFQSADMRRDRLESDYRVTSTFYTELMNRYESAKMDLQKETPIFKTLEQPVIPFKKSGPKRAFVVAIFSVLGSVTGLILSLLMQYKIIGRIFN